MIFISHDFDDRVPFQNVADALERESIAYFPPETIRTGADLSVELKKIIQLSDACIFVATPKSVRSQWCLAELGAFWGTGKHVLVFLPDEQLDDRDLPPYLHLHLFERRIKKIVDSVKSIIAEQRPTTSTAKRRVGDLTLPELHEILASSVQLAQTSSLFSFNLLRLADILRPARRRQKGSETLKIPFMEYDNRIVREVTDLLSFFLGTAESVARNANTVPWRYRNGFKTTTGIWYAYSSISEDVVGGLEIMQECVLFRLDHGRVVAAAVVGDIRDFSYAVTEQPNFSVGNAFVVVGDGEVGKSVGSLGG